MNSSSGPPISPGFKQVFVVEFAENVTISVEEMANFEKELEAQLQAATRFIILPPGVRIHSMWIESTPEPPKKLGPLVCLK